MEVIQSFFQKKKAKPREGKRASYGHTAGIQHCLCEPLMVSYHRVSKVTLDCILRETSSTLNVPCPAPDVPTYEAISRPFPLSSYWSIVDLQCRTNFLLYGSDSVIHLHVYSFSYSFPLWFISEDWIWFPVLFSRTLCLSFLNGIVCIF